MKSLEKTAAFLFLCILCIGAAACDSAQTKITKSSYSNNDQHNEISTQVVHKTHASHSDTPLKPSENFTLVMLGDSITAGYGLPRDQALPKKLEAALREQSHEIMVINAGVSGDTTGNALSRFNWSVEQNADGILIALGGNDLLQGIAPEKTRSHLEQIIKSAKKRNLVILLAGMKAPGNYGSQYQKKFDKIYSDLAKQYDLPLYPFLLEGVAARPELNQADGIHPNEKGVAILVENIKPFIIDSLSK